MHQQMEGKFTVGGDGSVRLTEEAGLDFAAVTVQMPGGERVPFLFTVKEMDLKGKVDGTFEGSFLVPSYRGSTFLDPKVSWWSFLKSTHLFPRIMLSAAHSSAV